MGLLPLNSSCGVEARSGGVEDGFGAMGRRRSSSSTYRSTPAAAWASPRQHSSPPLNSGCGGGLEAGSGLPTAALLLLHLWVNSDGGLGLPVAALLLLHVRVNSSYGEAGSGSTVEDAPWRRIQ